MKLGDYIRQYRKTHELSQRQFASACGLSYGYISMLEKGVNTSTGAPIVPTLQTMRSLADAMGTTIHKIALEVDDLYLDLDGGQRQPTDTDGLSAEENALLKAFRSLTPEQRAFVLRQLSAATPDPSDPGGSESNG